MIRLNFSQAKAIADFFINLASAWVIAAMITPVFTNQIFSLDFLLDFFRGITYGAGSLYMALYFLKEAHE